MADPTAAPNLLDALASLVGRVTAPTPGPAAWKPPTPPQLLPEPEPATGAVGARIGRGYPIDFGDGGTGL